MCNDELITQELSSKYDNTISPAATATAPDREADRATTTVLIQGHDSHMTVTESQLNRNIHILKTTGRTAK